MFFTTAMLTRAVSVASGELRDVAENLSPNKAKAEDFMSAVNSYDLEKSNKLIINAVKSYTGTPNVWYGLALYCRKFGINADDFASMSFGNIVKYISSKAAQIDEKLRAEGV